MGPQSLTWLNAEFIQKVLRSSEKDDTIEVKDVTTQCATEAGDNYLSVMLRVKVIYSRNQSLRKVTDEKSIVIKVAPTDGSKDFVAELGVFNTEINMFENVLVKMNKMLEEEGCRVSPRILYTTKEKLPLIVMQDLSSLGFRMADRQAGLDLDHCIHAIKGLARFHATSVAIREKDPKALAAYNKNPMTSNDRFIKVWKKLLSGIATEILNWQELGSSRQSYSEKIEKLSETYVEKYVACITPKDGEFIVLNHGDCWVNNMLFKYNDDGKVIDHVFVDFQMCLLSSPAVDILNFVSSSFSQDVVMHHYDTILEEYLATLTKTMTRLNCSTKPPDMANLKKTLKKYQFLGVLSSLIYLPFMLVDKSDCQTIDEIIQDGASHVNRANKTPAFRKTMLRLLPEWNATGGLDS